MRLQESVSLAAVNSSFVSPGFVLPIWEVFQAWCFGALPDGSPSDGQSLDGAGEAHDTPQDVPSQGDTAAVPSLVAIASAALADWCPNVILNDSHTGIDPSWGEGAHSQEWQRATPRGACLDPELPE